MPIKRCIRDGKEGWKWGDAGYCYIGPIARAQAEEQGRAIEADKVRRSRKRGYDGL